MILHIYPIADSNSVLLIDDYGHFSKSRDLVFGSLDVMRVMYEDIIMHLEPIS